MQVLYITLLYSLQLLQATASRYSAPCCPSCSPHLMRSRAVYGDSSKPHGRTRGHHGREYCICFIMSAMYTAPTQMTSRRRLPRLWSKLLHLAELQVIVPSKGSISLMSPASCAGLSHFDGLSQVLQIDVACLRDDRENHVEICVGVPNQRTLQSCTE